MQKHSQGWHQINQPQPFGRLKTTALILVIITLYAIAAYGDGQTMQKLFNQ